MEKMIDRKTKKALKEVIFQFFDRNKDKVFIFGSNATGQSRRYSDIDIGIESVKKISWSKISLLEEALSESDLPYKVEIVDFNEVSESFKQVAKKKIISLN